MVGWKNQAHSHGLAGGRMMNVQDAAIQILKDAGKPLHAKEIAERIILVD